MTQLQEEYLQLIKWHFPLLKKTRQGVYNCRCPFCGDSKKNKTSKHGYFYTKNNNMFYKCYKCISTTFDKVLERIDPELYLTYKIDSFKASRHFLIQEPIKKEPEVLDLKFKSVRELHDTHPVVQYVVDRVIPRYSWDNIFYIDDINKVSSKLEKYKETNFPNGDCLVFKFIRDNRLTHILFRNVSPTCPKGFRYTSLELISDVPKVFGYERVDETKQIKVVEGPIDSLFLGNCIAMSGTSIDYSFLKNKDVVFLFDKEQRNKHVIRAIEKVVDEGFKICLFDDTFNGKDINDFVKNGKSVVDIEGYIRYNTVQGLEAKLQLINYVRC
jgi:hypothetical protein